MRDNPNGKCYCQAQASENGRAVKTPQPYQPTQQAHKHRGEEMVAPALLPTEHLLAGSKEAFTDEISADNVQIKRLPRHNPEYTPASFGSHDRKNDQSFINHAASDWKDLPATDLLPLLLHPDFSIRANALRRAKLLAPPFLTRILSSLESALDDPLASVRIAAIEALGNLDRNEVIQLFEQPLRDPEWQVRATTVRELGKLGPDAPRSILIEALDDPDVSVRDTAIWALKPLAVWAYEEMKDKQPLNALIKALRDKSELVRAAAVEAAGDLHQHTPIMKLVHILDSDKSELVRIAAAGALSKLYESIPASALLHTLHVDESEFVRAAAAEALGKLHDAMPVDKLLLALHHDESEFVRAAAAEALSALHKYMPVSQLLMALHHDTSELVRASVVKSLSMLRESTPGEALEALILTLKDEAEEVREQARISLGRLYEHIYERASLPFLCSLLQDECDDVRLLAVWALGERRERTAQELLKDTLLDTNHAVQDAAVWALEQLAKHASSPTNESLGSNSTASPQAIENMPEDEQGEENGYAKDLFLALVDFVKGKKGFIKAETRGERVLVLKCYYQKDDESLQEAVLNHKQGASSIQHLENALCENDEMVQDLARHALRKRERRRWTETFLVSINLTQRNGQYLIDDIPTRIIVCSIAYHQVRDDDVSICRSIDQYVKENSGRLIYERASEWLGRCKEPIFRYARGVSGVKVWYDCITSPAHI